MSLNRAREAGSRPRHTSFDIRDIYLTEYNEGCVLNGRIIASSEQEMLTQELSAAIWKHGDLSGKVMGIPDLFERRVNKFK